MTNPYASEEETKNLRKNNYGVGLPRDALDTLELWRHKRREYLTLNGEL